MEAITLIIMKPKVLIPTGQIDLNLVRKLERYARVCYKSEDKISNEINYDFLRVTIKRGHESVIEHEKATVMFIVDRGVTHEIVRHRIASYSQESTRYCNYSKEKFGKEVTFIEPFFLVEKPKPYEFWKNACAAAESNYLLMLEEGCTPQEARSVLTNSLKTEIITTYNIREWRHFLKLRCAPEAHPQMRQVTIPLLLYFKKQVPVLFEDISYDLKFPQEYYAEVLITDLLLNPIKGLQS